MPAVRTRAKRRIPGGGGKSVNAIWMYEEPYEVVAAIREHPAFDPDRVDTLTY